MAVAFKNHADEPIMIATFSNPLNAGKDTVAFNEAIQQRLPTVNDQLWVVADLTGTSISFVDGVFGLAEAARSSIGAFRDKRVRMVLVGGGDMINFLLRSAEQAQYGGVKGHAAGSMEEALAYCREHISKNGSQPPGDAAS